MLEVNIYFEAEEKDDTNSIKCLIVRRNKMFVRKVFLQDNERNSSNTY